MERYQVILAYDGTQFQGFQKQGQARTVQGVVEEALRRIGWQGSSLLAAGRTDTGVHASGQVIVFDLNWRHTTEALLLALNANLPEDVAAQSVQPAPSEFHPRYDALWRRYRYSLFCSRAREPLKERYAWRLWPPVSWELLQEVSASLPGCRDFRAFGAPLKPGGSTVRTILRSEWQRDGSYFTFEISADAFLYHMVRRLVYLQVMIAQGRLDAKTFARSLTDPELSLPPGLAPARGLSLLEVAYLPGLQCARISLENQDQFV
jgi:tRNA pseudouridine38-40 synthase